MSKAFSFLFFVHRLILPIDLLPPAILCLAHTASHRIPVDVEAIQYKHLAADQRGPSVEMFQ